MQVKCNTLDNFTSGRDTNVLMFIDSLAHICTLVCLLTGKHRKVATAIREGVLRMGASTERYRQRSVNETAKVSTRRLVLSANQYVLSPMTMQ